MNDQTNEIPENVCLLNLESGGSLVKSHKRDFPPHGNPCGRVVLWVNVYLVDMKTQFKFMKISPSRGGGQYSRFQTPKSHYNRSRMNLRFPWALNPKPLDKSMGIHLSACLGQRALPMEGVKGAFGDELPIAMP